jgi:hypothetical protein
MILDSIFEQLTAGVAGFSLRQKREGYEGLWAQAKACYSINQCPFFQSKTMNLGLHFTMARI